MATVALDQGGDAIDNIIRFASVSCFLGLVGLCTFTLTTCLYNVLFHPLRSYPGPLLWRLTSIPFEHHTFNGTLNRKVQKLHQKYGLVVRIAPKELSYADSQVWKDVWSSRNPEFPKRAAPMPPNGSYSILNAPKDEHARFRRLLAHAFSERGLRDQEPRVKEYIDLLVERLRETAVEKQSTDIVDWYTRTVFDVIGDLAWGEPFNGVQKRFTHEWIPAILANVKYVMQGGVFKRWVSTSCRIESPRA